jgi:hypothetical protein
MSFIESHLAHNVITTLLDCGCGRGKWGYAIKTSPFYKDLNNCLLVGCDIYLLNLKFVKYHKIYDDVVLCDACFLPFRRKSIDLVLACELIEHLDKKHGFIFLDELDLIFNYAIIISTPRIFFKNILLKNLLERKANPFELHKSLWSANEFRKKGYRVIGVGSRFTTIKYLRNLDLNTVLRFFIKIFLSGFSFLFADLGESIVAIKKKDDI